MHMVGVGKSVKKHSSQPQCINVEKRIEKCIKGKEGERKNET